MKDGGGPLVGREMSWLEFNQRVLDEALDPEIPVLERLKFLAITASNLDEFFMVRVGGLQLLDERGSRRRDATGCTPRRQLEMIGGRVRRMVADQYRCYGGQLEPALSAAGIRRTSLDALTERQADYVKFLFAEEIQAVVTPLAVDADNRFPLLRNLGLHLAVRRAPAGAAQEERLAVVSIGPSLSRFNQVPAAAGYSFVLIEDIVARYIGQLFPGEQVIECAAFRITRNADMAVEDEFAADLLMEMQQVIDARKQSACVRLEIDQAVSPELLAALQERIGVASRDVYRVDGPPALSDFMKLATRAGFDELKYDDWPPQPSPDVDRSAGLFDVIAGRSLLLCHPYESFDPVVALVVEAADDPDVLAIKQILYRTSRNSPIVAALKRAAERGKYVTAIVELKARFDEARNIEWARELEMAGVQVIYGVKGLKTHAKVCIVVRRETQGVVRYVHFGTGNYNEVTARLYTDISYLTTDRDLAADAAAFFNAVTGRSQPTAYLKLAAAPLSLRARLLEMIRGEEERSRQGQQGLILAKMNALVDPDLITALYSASAAGVKIELNVRGTCCLRPGVPGLSENIRVVSIIDRFLEHSRIYYFRHGGDEKVFISSADWMPRNLDRRAELLIPIDDKLSRKRLVAVLKTCLRDNVKGRVLGPDGLFAPPARAGRKPVRSQEVLYREACRRAEDHRQLQRTLFEPHEPADEKR